MLNQLAKEKSYRYAPYRILAQITLKDQENLNTEDYHKALDRMLNDSFDPGVVPSELHSIMPLAFAFSSVRK